MLIRLGAAAVAAIALVQWWQLADRAHHVVRMYRKFGEFPVDASVSGLIFFLSCSFIGAAVGVAIVRRARAERAWPYQLARISTGALLAGAATWPAAIISPFVILGDR